MAAKFNSIDAYISSFPDEVQALLRQVRSLVHSAMPGAEETISYDMPTMVRGKTRVYFAAWKKHLAFYGWPKFDDDLEGRVSPFRAEKGTVQFPFKQPIPFDLIAEVVSRIAKPTETPS